MNKTWETSSLACPYCGSTRFWTLSNDTATRCSACNRTLTYYLTQRLPY